MISQVYQISDQHGRLDCMPCGLSVLPRILTRVHPLGRSCPTDLTVKATNHMDGREVK